MIESNRYLYLKENPALTYKIDRYTNVHPGDSVAVQHGNVAHIEPYNHQSILGKATSKITKL